MFDWADGATWADEGDGADGFGKNFFDFRLNFGSKIALFGGGFERVPK